MKSTFFGERDNKGILGKSLMQDFTPGFVLADFFEISEKAREGGMGDVFFCRDKRDNKFYVLKTYKKANSSFEDFSKEAELILKLKKHPHVVYAKTIITDADNYYIVMEYVGKQPYTIDDPVQGETLARVMDKVKIEPKQALIWAIQFCQGMKFLHQSGIETHKDIKPDNILITPENNIKIADFGLAGLDKKGGTIGYRAPEYFKEGEKLTIQSDIYSFGLVLYQMLNGGKSLPNATIWDEKTKEYEKIDVNNIQSEHCLEIITKCLAENPEERYEIFKEIEIELKKYLKATFPEYQYEEQKTGEMTANDYFLKGKGFILLQDKIKAFRFFSKAINKNPKNSYARYYRYISDPGLNFLATFFNLSISLVLTSALCSFSLWFTQKSIILSILSYLFFTSLFLFYVKWCADFSRLRAIKYLFYMLSFSTFLPPIIHDLIELYFPSSIFVNFFKPSWSLPYYYYPIESAFTMVLFLWGILFLGLIPVLWILFKQIKASSNKIEHLRIFLTGMVSFLKITLELPKDLRIAVKLNPMFQSLYLLNEFQIGATRNERRSTHNKKREAIGKLKKIKEVPKDYLTYLEIKNEMEEKHFEKALPLISYFEENFPNSGYFPFIFTRKLSILRILRQNEGSKMHEKMLENCRSYLDNVYKEKNFFINLYSSSNNIFLSKEEKIEYCVKLLALIYYEGKPQKEGEYTLLKGALAFQIGNYDIALDNYEKALGEIVVADDVLKRKLLMLKENFSNYLNEEEFELLKNSLNERNCYLECGVAALMLKNYSKAFSYLNLAIEKDPKREVLYFYRFCAGKKRFFYKGMLTDYFTDFKMKASTIGMGKLEKDLLSIYRDDKKEDLKYF